MRAPRASAGLLHGEQDGADTVERFAEKNAISRAQAFKEIAAGRLTARKVGSRTIITHEDAAKWRRALPRASVNGAAKRPGDGLPAWLSEPRPSRHRAKPKTRPPTVIAAMMPMMIAAATVHWPRASGIPQDQLKER